MEKSLKKYFPVFVVPTLAAFTIGFFVPFVEGIYLSFCKFTTVNDATFIGFDNYTRAFTDKSFTFVISSFRTFGESILAMKIESAFWFTVLFAVVVTTLINVCAIFIANLLTKSFKGTTVFRSVFFMPNLIGGIILGYIWQSLINGVLYISGLPLIAVNSKAGFCGLVILMCWQQIGYMMIIYIAGLQNIPGDIIESSQIDGASPWKTFWEVRFPMLMPSVTICLFLSLTNAFKLFDQNLALTSGEPSKFTEMLALNIYSTFYSRAGAQWKGLGQSKAVIFFVVVVLIAFIQLRATRSREVQQ